METYSSMFFEDGHTTINYVLVYRSATMTDETQTKLEIFVDNLQKSGLSVEISPFSTEPKIYFMKIHMPRKVGERFADIFSIDLAFKRAETPSHIKVPLGFMATPLTNSNKNNPIIERTRHRLADQLPKDITSSEKIMILHKVLSRTKFGSQKTDYGIHRLLKDKVLTDAFPLHDGPHQWTDSGPLTDRQLLVKFWGTPRCWHKEQPLNLIEKYYGTELAFYFAWVGFYLKMLVPAAIMSFLCILYGIVTITSNQNQRSKEICSSTVMMCPRCHYSHCKFEKLSNSCFHSHITYIFDNPATITFAVIISFWSTIFLELWEREQAILQLEWNVKYLEHDISMRPEYVEAAARTRISPITGLREPYFSTKMKIAKYAVTIASSGLLLAIMVLGIFGVLMYRLTVSLIIHSRDKDEKLSTRNTQLIAVMSGSLISVCFIFIFKVIYTKLALWLTNFENHRTQDEFDHSYIYKSYALAFTNHYAVIFYIAFCRGKFFTHPGDIKLWTTYGGLGSDVCDPTGCIIDLGVHVMCIMIIKIFINNVVQIIVPMLIGFIQRRWYKAADVRDMPGYEKNYLMASLERYYLVDEYMDMVIQYGFVVLFVVGFPLAPFLAFINNLAELRVDAFKITRSFRRPMPVRVAGIGAWMGILRAVTYLGVMTNALIIAFTSDFVPMEIYRHGVDALLSGFIYTKISGILGPLSLGTCVTSFVRMTVATQVPRIPGPTIAYDSSELNSSIPQGTLCYYPGKRYPPDHPKRYELTADYWSLLAMRFLVVIIFEHVVMLTNGILAYAIPDVPVHVREKLALQERKNKEIKMAALNEEYDYKKRRSSIVGLISFD